MAYRPSLHSRPSRSGPKEERALVSANRELVERMERRITAAIGRVWYDQPELLVPLRQRGQPP